MPDTTTPLIDMEVVWKEMSYGTAAARKQKKAQAPTPKEISAKSPDGKTTTMRTVPKMLGMSEPPGGWFGPFGFLRMVANAFLFGAMMMAFIFLYALYSGDNLRTLVFCQLLLFASLLAAAAAYSHEGLANQVSKMETHNHAYAAMNEDFTKQIGALKHVADKVQELLGDKAERIEEFEQQMQQLEHVSSLRQISVVTRGFIDAQLRNELFDRSGDEELDGILTGDEVVSFMRGIQNTVEQSIPSFDLDDLMQHAFHQGLSLTEITLLVAAVQSEIQTEKECFMALLNFFMNPGKPGRVKEVVRTLLFHLRKHPKFGDENVLKKEVQRLASTAPPQSRIPRVETRELLKAVIHTFQTEDDDDLGISDDEEEEEDMV